MRSPERLGSSRGDRALSIALLYVVLGGGWILLTEPMQRWLSIAPEYAELFHGIKGWSYVLVTGLLLYVLIRANNQALHAAADARIAALEQVDAQRQLAANYTRTLIEASIDPLVTIAQDGTMTDVNRAMEAITGRSRSELIGDDFSRHFTEPARAREGYRAVLAEGTVRDYPLTIHHVSGSTSPVLFNATVFRSEAGTPQVFAAARDISERQRMEERLLQSQKLESVGMLAGGIAHDFNNMLGVVLGSTELVMRETDPSDPRYPFLEEVLEAVRRTTALTRQLLTFARKVPAAPQVLDLNEALRGMVKILQRLIGENVELAFQPAPRALPAYLDPSRLDQIVTNLCVNARDAISGTGRIVIQTGAATLDQRTGGPHPEAAPGDYVFLRVSDTGCGMTEPVLSRIFDPFYSTKGPGKGSGLGLSTVYGIVRQSGGYVEVRSQPGQGSVFEIYLPRHVPPAREAPAEKAEPALAGRGTVLVVEDSAPNLAVCAGLLRSLGYDVVACARPSEALALVERREGRIDLLLTDVVMPGMGGLELAARIHERFPNVRCLYMSGHPTSAVAPHGGLAPGVHILSKPFTRDEVAAKVTEVLRSAPPTSGDAAPAAPESP